jgi:hypothetical protein
MDICLDSSHLLAAFEVHREIAGLRGVSAKAVVP